MSRRVAKLAIDHDHLLSLLGLPPDTLIVDIIVNQNEFPRQPILVIEHPDLDECGPSGGGYCMGNVSADVWRIDAVPEKLEFRGWFK